jgi:hypothetical protein
MTQSTEQERTEFHEWKLRDNPKYKQTDDSMQDRRDWLVWQAARRAQVVPQGWKLVPVEPTQEMKRAGMSERHDDLSRSVYQAMLAAAPQPPEAAPVQMPEPWAISHHNRVQYSNAAWHGETPDGTKLYTDQQVRQLLAAQARKPLKDTEIGAAMDEVKLKSQCGVHHFGYWIDFTRVIERAHNITS